MNITCFLGESYFNNKIKGYHQYLPLYLSKTKHIYCIEYPQFKKLFKILFHRLPLLERISSTLMIYHSFGLLPFGRTYRWINRINYSLNYYLIKLKCKDIFSSSTFVTFTPELSILLPYLPYKKKIYYCIVDYLKGTPAWKSMYSKKQFDYLENKLLKYTNKVIVVSPALLKRYQKKHKKVVLFSTPGEIIVYLNSKAKEISIPNDIKNISHPIVGYIGYLYSYKVDMTLLIKTLNSYPNISFVFIGSEKDNLNKTLGLLPNYFHLGYKQFEKLPCYMSQFDACIIPYKINIWGKSAYPGKLNDYIAMGKPVVTSPIPSIRFLGRKKIIYWSKNKSEFIKHIQTAIMEKQNKKLMESRKKYATINSWENRIGKFISIIDE